MTPTVRDALDAVRATGLEVTTFVWPDGHVPPLPYAVLVPHESRGQVAGNEITYRVRRYDVELYMREVDFRLMHDLEDRLDEAGISASSDMAVDESGRVAIAYYSMTLSDRI